MKTLIAPLNWGLGHASRCVPLINQYLKNGNEVVIASDGAALTFLRKRYPDLRYVELPALNLHYSNGNSQISTLLKQLPHCLKWAVSDHKALDRLLNLEKFDLVISDNRFFFYNKRVKSVYLTHQLNLILPKHWKWLTPVANLINRKIINRYTECWIPDNQPDDGSLAGQLSKPVKLKIPIVYKGILSRFEGITVLPQTGKYDVVAILSGLEPQRTLFEKKIIKSYLGNNEQVLLVEGKLTEALCEMQINNITILPYLDDNRLAFYLTQAKKIIARSGYSTIMDFATLGILKKTDFIPTPGQTEQEYLAQRISYLRIKNSKDCK